MGLKERLERIEKALRSTAHKRIEEMSDAELATIAFGNDSWRYMTSEELDAALAEIARGGKPPKTGQKTEGEGGLE